LENEEQRKVEEVSSIENLSFRVAGSEKSKFVFVPGTIFRLVQIVLSTNRNQLTAWGINVLYYGRFLLFLKIFDKPEK
jgi:hypothetical protein